MQQATSCDDEIIISRDVLTTTLSESSDHMVTMVATMVTVKGFQLDCTSIHYYIQLQDADGTVFVALYFMFTLHILKLYYSRNGYQLNNLMSNGHDQHTMSNGQLQFM